MKLNKILILLLAVSCISVAAEVKPYAKNFNYGIKLGIATGLAVEEGETLKLKVSDGKNKWPGVVLMPIEKSWDLSKYAGIKFKIKNTSATKLRVGLRVDNIKAKGYMANNAAALWIPAGETKELIVTFGTSHGNSGKPINSAKITGACVFFDHSKLDSTMEVLNISPDGKANPEAVAPLKPEKFFAMKTDKNVIDLKISPNRLDTKLLKNGHVAVKTILNSGQWPGVNLMPKKGHVDLSAYKGVSFTIKNTSDHALNLAARVDNPGADGNSNCNTETLYLAAGGTKETKITFGQSWGNKAFNLNTKDIVNFLVFFGSLKPNSSFEIIEIKAWGQADRTAKPQANVALKFESKKEYFRLTDGEITTDVDKVISGKSSVLADPIGKNRKWFEFMTTTPGLLAGGYEYEVSFSYKVLTASKDSKFYTLFRSKGEGWGKFDRNWTDVKNISEDIGKVKTQTYIGKIGELNDYMLMFGVTGDAIIVIDDLKITKGKPYVELSEVEKYLARIPKDAQPYLELNFENENGDNYKLHQGAQLKKDGAIKGEQSLFVDTTATTGSWRNFISIGKGMLENGYTYYITGYLKTTKKKSRHSQWFVYLQGNGGEKSKRNWTNIKATEGKSNFFYIKFTPREYDGYVLYVGAQNGIAGYLDNVTVKRVKAAEYKIATRKPLDRSKAKLIFEENFDGTKLSDVWTVHDMEKRRNGLWVKESIQVKDGNLELIFDKNNDGIFVMGCIDTPKKFEFKYGYVEARMKNPKQVGHWPGIWLFNNGVNKVGNEGKDGTEIDIVEAPWRNKDKISHALHWDGYGSDHQVMGHTPTIEGINEGFHTYAVDWSEDGYIFFVDGKETWRTDAGGGCEIPLYLMISDEEGGWSGNPNKAKNLPDKTYVDYIKVWQKK